MSSYYVLSLSFFPSMQELKRLEHLVYKAMLVANMIEQRISRMETSTSGDEESAVLERRIRYMQEQFDGQCQCAHTLATMIEQFGVGSFSRLYFIYFHVVGHSLRRNLIPYALNKRRDCIVSNRKFC